MMEYLIHYDAWNCYDYASCNGWQQGQSSAYFNLDVKQQEFWLSLFQQKYCSLLQ